MDRRVIRPPSEFDGRFGIKNGGNLVTKHGIEKIIRAPKDYDPNLGA